MATANMSFSNQIRLFDAAGPDAGVGDALALAGLSIDDLVYENSKTCKWRGGPPAEMSSFREAAGGIPIVSFFTGCGGMDLGFEAVGFAPGFVRDFRDVLQHLAPQPTGLADFRPPVAQRRRVGY